MDFIGHPWTTETKKALIFQGFFYLDELSWMVIWWS